MSLQNVVLPDTVIAELYKNVCLITGDNETETSTKTSDEPGVAGIKFLGSNLKKIAIIVKHTSEVFLPEKHLDFLSRILAACKLNLGDVAIVNEGHRFVDINSIRQQLQPDHIILFGVDPIELRLPMNFPHFKVQAYADCAYLSVPALDLLNADTDECKLLKTKLWVCLKNMFEVDSGK